jgi:hypothetical protein
MLSYLLKLKHITGSLQFISDNRAIETIFAINEGDEDLAAFPTVLLREPTRRQDKIHHAKE